MDDNFAVIGNPVYHSYSPYIHSVFASEYNIKNHNYIHILSPLNDLKKIIHYFFYINRGLGVNITIPFKEQAYSICNLFTNRSLLSRTVNTIKKFSDGSLLGDNTDGIGLIADLLRLNFLITNNYKKNKILIIGAGGTAKSIIPGLLVLGCNVFITNRTFEKTKKLVNLYKKLGNIEAIPLEKLNNPIYNIIINATSSSLKNEIPSISSKLITKHVCCYDVFYKFGYTSFIAWCYSNQATKCEDGLGMLIYQAAYSFYLWYGIFPKVLHLIKKIKLLNII